MAKRSRAEGNVIAISSSSEQENGYEESEPLSEWDDDYDAASRDDFDSSASSQSDGDYEDDDDDNIQEEGEESGCDRVLRGCGELRKLRTELGKLTLTDCKTYLRSNGLRLSGTKEECIQRIIEHWSYDAEHANTSGTFRMKDGNGQRQYPRSSFTINCTGDVCKGDVVLFKQKVFDKMTRGGEPLGKRTIAGRIVKESYGAAKQQHTFTRWKDEEERLEVLAEKHKRGEAARSIRATRKSKSIKPTKASSKNRGNKRQKLDHHRRPSEMMQTSNVKKHKYSINERGKAMAGSNRTKHHQRKPHPPGRLNLGESRNSRPRMRNPNFVLDIGDTSLQFNYPSANNFRHSESDSYIQRVPYSYSSNWGSAPRSHLSSYSYPLPAPEHQQYGHGSYPHSSHPRYVSQSSNFPHSPGMVGAHRSSGSTPFVNYERIWNS
ncbi:hypothetical protein RND71_032853 [Anisodus tanguticus]|uniref:SAP domain-containing protein n=1 Tax=Anisodus tanguticus TaxID=243964 RepID=A0AAE1R6R2_9SOLA|nr:hypothetical protein RND71_032853 [Anisodus tanguticus]